MTGAAPGDSIISLAVMSGSVWLGQTGSLLLIDIEQNILTSNHTSHLNTEIGCRFMLSVSALWSSANT